MFARRAFVGHTIPRSVFPALRICTIRQAQRLVPPFVPILSTCALGQAASTSTMCQSPTQVLGEADEGSLGFSSQECPTIAQLMSLMMSHSQPRLLKWLKFCTSPDGMLPATVYGP